jgi:hypothetical protein
MTLHEQKQWYANCPRELADKLGEKNAGELLVLWKILSVPATLPPSSDIRIHTNECNRFQKDPQEIR